MSHRLTWLPIAVLFLGQMAQAATYYVATNGSDSNPGSSAAPFLTLQQAVNTAFAGDSVIIEDGTYGHGTAFTGGDGSSYESSPVWLYNSGTPAAWITIKAQHKGAAILDCEMLCDSYINLFNASYIVIQDLVITRGYKEGIHSNDAAHHITLEGNRIEYIANRPSSSPYGLGGMYTNPNCHDFIIDGNVFHDIGRTSGSNSLDHGLYLQGSNFTITNNVFYHFPAGWAIQMADGLNNVLVANNTFAFPNPVQYGQIMLWNTQTNVAIQNNIFYNPQGYAIAHFGSSSNCAIDHNLVYGASLIWDTAGCSVGGSQSGGDPGFINAKVAPFDFHLQSNSPAIGKGVDLSSVLSALHAIQPVPTSLDLGAFPYQPVPALQLINTTTGLNVWHAGDGVKVLVTGGLPMSPVTVTIGTWTGILGSSDASGNFTFTGTTDASIVGTWSEIWAVGGINANPNPLMFTVLP